MYLLDTNILLELLLGREKADDADRFLKSVPTSEGFRDEHRRSRS
jgi:predicted nucleic acid-binding protein